MQEKNDLQVGCLLMAAGNASRFRANKLLMEYNGKPLIQYAMDAIDPDCIDRVVVVTQYPAVTALAEQQGHTWIQNDHPEWGASYTIALGTEALQDCDGILYMVADQPRLTAASVRRIVDTWRSLPSSIVAPVSGDRSGNPCIFPKALFGELMDLQGDVGGKQVIRRHPELLQTVELPAEELFDCDTPQALAALKETTE